MKIKMATGKDLSPQGETSVIRRRRIFIRCLLAEGWKGSENYPIPSPRFRREGTESGPFRIRLENTAKEGAAALIMAVVD